MSRPTRPDRAEVRLSGQVLLGVLHLVGMCGGLVGVSIRISPRHRAVHVAAVAVMQAGILSQPAFGRTTVGDARIVGRYWRLGIGSAGTLRTYRGRPWRSTNVAGAWAGRRLPAHPAAAVAADGRTRPGLAGTRSRFTGDTLAVS